MVWMILAFGRTRRIRPICEEVARQLVDNPDFAVRSSRQAGKIGLANPPQGGAIESGNALRIWSRLTGI